MTSLLCVSAGCPCPIWTPYQYAGPAPLCPSLCCTAPQQRVGLKCALSLCLHMSTIRLVLPSLLLPDTRHQALCSCPDPSPSTSHAAPPEYIPKLQPVPTSLALRSLCWLHVSQDLSGNSSLFPDTGMQLRFPKAPSAG